MREIKFKAWHKAHEKMVKVISLFQMDAGKVTYLQLYGYKSLMPVGTVELMQFTGLHDKNGMEIYEGDILKALKHNETPFIHKVEHRSGILWFGNWNWVEFQNIFRNVEVIGNIYENPDLLEVE